MLGMGKRLRINPSWHLQVMLGKGQKNQNPQTKGLIPNITPNMIEGYQSEAKYVKKKEVWSFAQCLCG